MGSKRTQLLVDLAVAALGAGPGRDSRDAVGGVLLSVLDADVITFNHVQPRCARAQVPIIGPSWAEAASPLPDVIGPALAAHPLVQHYAATGVTVPLTVTDVVPPSAWRNSAARSLVRELLGVEEQLAIRVRAPDGEVHAWVAMRAKGPFSQKTRSLAAQLQPILVAVEAQHEILARLPNSATATGSDASYSPFPDGLTAREKAVLSLVADGLTAVAIGHRLSISPRTVTTHLQNIYRKLDAADRLTAVLRARDLGILPSASHRESRTFCSR